MQDTQSTAQGNRYLTVPQLAEAHPAFSVGALRWLLFHRATNGLEVAVRRIGRRVLISEADFAAWLDDHREAPVSAPSRARSRRAA